MFKTHVLSVLQIQQGGVVLRTPPNFPTLVDIYI